MLLVALLFCISTLICNYINDEQETYVLKFVFFICSWIHLFTCFAIAHAHLKNTQNLKFFIVVWIDLLYLIFRCQYTHDQEVFTDE